MDLMSNLRKPMITLVTLRRMRHLTLSAVFVAENQSKADARQSSVVRAMRGLLPVRTMQTLQDQAYFPNYEPSLIPLHSTLGHSLGLLGIVPTMKLRRQINYHRLKQD